MSNDHCDILKFSIESLPPSWNRLYKKGKGRIYKDKSVWEPFLWSVQISIRGAVLPGNQYSLSCLLRMHRQHEGDVDNSSKSIGDALQELGVIANDKLIFESNWRKEIVDFHTPVSTDVVLTKLS